MTRRPEITPANYQAVYDYYRTPRYSAKFQRRVGRIANWLYHPDVVCSDEVRAQLDEQFAQGKGALVALNHPSEHDPLVTTAAARQINHPALRGFLVYAKDSLFHGALTRPVEKLGALPTFRTQNHQDLTFAELRDMYAMQAELAVEQLKRGQPIGLYVEGTCSDPSEYDQLKLTSVKSGIGQIALAAGQEHSYILPIALRYRTPDPRTRVMPPRHTVINVGAPITEYAERAIGVRN